MNTAINGWYEVGDSTFTNKIFALIEASKKNTSIKFNYFNDIFSAVEKTKLGQRPLSYWYRTRAQQIRDNYDYILLNYSGGSDSHNILHTFLKNNIKLDCVYVQMPFKLLENTTLHKPNSLDTSNENYHSEWNFCIKKDLEFLALNYPKIKIELGDYTDTFSRRSFYSDNLFETNSQVMPNISRGLKLHTFSKFENDMANKGKRVASIYGAGKPYIITKDNRVFIFFYDRGLPSIPNPANLDGVEYFYWTPKLPELVLEQAYAVYNNYFKINKDKKYLVLAKSQRTEPGFKNWPWSKHKAELDIYYNIVKKICYPYWDFNRFQSSKPTSNDLYPIGFRPWDKLLLGLPEFQGMSQVWDYYWSSYYNQIDKKYLRAKDETINIKSEWIYLCNE